jgi:hypothetical protein
VEADVRVVKDHIGFAANEDRNLLHSVLSHEDVCDSGKFVTGYQIVHNIGVWTESKVKW